MPRPHWASGRPHSGPQRSQPQVGRASCPPFASIERPQFCRARCPTYLILLGAASSAPTPEAVSLLRRTDRNVCPTTGNPLSALLWEELHRGEACLAQAMLIGVCGELRAGVRPAPTARLSTASGQECVPHRMSDGDAPPGRLYHLLGSCRGGPCGLPPRCVGNANGRVQDPPLRY